MKLPAFDYQRPASIEAVIRILTDFPGDAKIIAGGQSLLPVMAFRFASPSVLVDLAGVPGLKDIVPDDEGVWIGAMVRWVDIERSACLRTACPLVPAAVEHIAHYQVRNRGTIGGSLSHADPAAEMPGIIITCDAELEVVGPAGARRIPASEFIIGPLTTSMADDDVLTRIRFPAWPSARRWAFTEFSQRRGDYAYAGVALYYDEDAEGKMANAHIGVIAAATLPCRLHEAEQALNGKRLDDALIEGVSQLAANGFPAQEDPHASAAYRRSLVATLVEQTLRQASTRNDHP